jgi:hypothetical protein
LFELRQANHKRPIARRLIPDSAVPADAMSEEQT